LNRYEGKNVSGKILNNRAIKRKVEILTKERQNASFKRLLVYLWIIERSVRDLGLLWGSGRS